MCWYPNPLYFSGSFSVSSFLLSAYRTVKAGVADGSSGQSHLPAVRAVTGIFRMPESGVKTASGNHVCGHYPRTPTVTTKNREHALEKSRF